MTLWEPIWEEEAWPDPPYVAVSLRPLSLWPEARVPLQPCLCVSLAQAWQSLTGKGAVRPLLWGWAWSCVGQGPP